jgi:hypothetical protein
VIAGERPGMFDGTSELLETARGRDRISGI